jgi:ElaB/YqjD/DUF883 family membrane-anchored ribosome-binding protein
MSTYPTDPTTPMSDDPDVLRRQIEQTRAELSRDVDALGEAASPGNVARRQAEKVTDKVRGAGHTLKEKVMGSDDPYGSEPGLAGRAGETVSGAGHRVGDTVSDLGHRVGDTTSELGHRVGDVAGSAQQTLASAPEMARRQTRGNPLAAGLVALGAGWLLGSLLPGSEKERELAVTARERMRDSDLVDQAVQEVRSAGQHVVEEVRPRAQEAVDQVRQSATESVEHVKEEATTATEDVRSSAQESKDAVQEHREQQG